MPCFTPKKIRNVNDGIFFTFLYYKHFLQNYSTLNFLLLFFSFFPDLSIKSDFQVLRLSSWAKPFTKWAGFSRVLLNLSPKKTVNAEALSVNCKWVLKNWHSHLGSTSHPSQTNEAPSASKWDWSPFETRHRTLRFWIWRKVPLAMETHEPALPPHPILHWRDVEKRGPGGVFQLHQYSLIHRESWQQIFNCMTGWMFSFVTVRSDWNGILN